MKPIFNEPHGEQTERRFLESARKRTTQTPKWFVDIRYAGPKFDVKGVDMLASIQRPDDPKPMTVPVQIKSSTGGKHSYYQSHPDAKEVKVPVLVVEDTKTADQIRAELYIALEPFLHVRRDHFKSYLSGLGKQSLSARGRKIKAHIKRTRKKP